MNEDTKSESNFFNEAFSEMDEGYYDGGYESEEEYESEGEYESEDY